MIPINVIYEPVFMQYLFMASIIYGVFRIVKKLIIRR